MYPGNITSKPLVQISISVSNLIQQQKQSTIGKKHRSKKSVNVCRTGHSFLSIVTID